MENHLCADKLMESTASKIQQLQRAFAELESHRAVTLNFKWKQLEEHFNGLQNSLKRRFTELEEQEKDFDAKIAESKDILEKRKAAVMAKEQASLERLQEKRDAAVSAILIAGQKHLGPFSANSVSDAIANQVNVPAVNKKRPCSMAAECNIDILNSHTKSSYVRVKSYPELVKLCREMNSEGLLNFIADNRRDITTLREEIPIALRASSDPGTLVLNSLKGFYGSDVPNFDAKKDSNLLGLRRTCILLMECLSKLVIDQDGDFPCCTISGNAKQMAKVIAENWEPKLEDLDADANNGNSLEAHAFLQLLATFGIYTDFDQKSLCKLIPMVARRRQTAELCRYLGLTDRMPGVIDSLVRNGRQIDAVNLAFAFDLTERFSPIPLLKSYLLEAKKATSSTAKVGNTSPAAAAASSQSDLKDKDLTALKAVMKCIEDHKLEEQFPIEPLQKQVLGIEKAKAEKKRATEVAKPQSKRPRATASNAYAAARVSSTAFDKSSPHTTRMNDHRYPQYAYERPYAAYPVVPRDQHISPYMGTPAYAVSPLPPPSHGNYFGNGYHYHTAAYLH
ncbi:hypothetical protein M569_06588 [Genlisea aurea]|uniref:FRIGIDA-like protein n=1 Tax=Genlisea aurea TaxID=192259 RepID=S8E6Z4_9LAMI|nr:hypothetical protein M569_06588 [Genlisea aurea]